MSKIICKNGGTFTIKGKDVTIKQGDPVPDVLADAALQQGWGYSEPSKKKAEK